MSETPAGSPMEAPKKSNTGLIIGIVVVLLLCCCCISALGGWYLWENGDDLFATGYLLIPNFV
ncbi:MAG: hypothetical protein FJZ87_01075 [Chloroflexi bacterium]|nr:hypothetical protein [Chloroflexota bacterium]